MSVSPELPAPQIVMAADGVPLATYAFGDPDAPVVLAVHGFSSSAADNWLVTGWVRDLTAAGLRVVAYDQRGHGASGKPHDPAAYRMAQLVADVETVVDTWLLDDVRYLGYSLGARVGWFAASEVPHRIERAVLGGLSLGDDLDTFDLEAARRHAADGSPIEHPLTAAYVGIAERNPANDLEALIALIEGMRGGPQPLEDEPPQQPLLVATGSEDRIIDVSRSLAAAAPAGRFVEIAGRNHFNAPTSGEFRRAGVAALREGGETGGHQPT
jgi:pimeloyl-ACP methyl ester carboxylesterase